MNHKLLLLSLCFSAIVRAETPSERLAREAAAAPAPAPVAAASGTSISDAMSQSAVAPTATISAQAVSNDKPSTGSGSPSSPLGSGSSSGASAPTSSSSAKPDPSTLPEPTFERIGPAVMVGPCKVDGWVPVAMEGVAFRSFGSTTLYNGKSYSVKTPPFLLVPKDKDDSVTIDPRVLPVVNHLVREEKLLLSQLRSELEASQPVTVELAAR